MYIYMYIYTYIYTHMMYIYIHIRMHHIYAHIVRGLWQLNLRHISPYRPTSEKTSGPPKATPCQVRRFTSARGPRKPWEQGNILTKNHRFYH